MLCIIIDVGFITAKLERADRALGRMPPRARSASLR